MQWRIARHKKRLARFTQAARATQRAWWAFLARTLADKMRLQRVALFIQVRWRATFARDELEEVRKEE